MGVLALRDAIIEDALTGVNSDGAEELLLGLKGAI